MDLDNMSDEEFEIAMNEAATADPVVVDEPVAEEEPVIEANVEPEVQGETEPEVVVEEENVQAESEQPVEDSANITAEDNENVDTKEEEPKVSDEITDDNSEPEDDTQVTSKDDVQVEPETYEVAANGAKYKLTLDEMRNLASKGFNYTTKTQELKDHKKLLSKMKEGKLAEADLDLMIDVLKGDKTATTALLKRTGVDVDALVLDIDEEVNYVPKTYGKTDVELEIQEVFEEIDKDPEAQITRHVIAQQWDDGSRDMFVGGTTLSNGKKITGQDLMRGLHDDIKNGTFDKVSPEAMKLKALDGGRRSDIEYYMDAGQQYYAKELMSRQKAEADLLAETKAKEAREAEEAAVAAAKQKLVEAEKVKQDAAARTAATTPKKVAGTGTIIDYLDMDSISDEEFAEMMEKQIK